MKLTPRQKEIIVLAGQGTSTTEIAKKLSIAPATVTKHFRNIFLKLNIKSKSLVLIGRSTNHD